MARDGGGRLAGRLRLTFDHRFPYVGSNLDPRLRPRLAVYVARSRHDESPVGIEPLLDSGAEHTLFDGTLGLYLGWHEQDLVDRAEETRPIYGLGASGPALPGYLHRLRCLIPLGRRFATLELRAFLTPPNTLSTPVLGRRAFFQQVDFALVEAEQRFYLRFRDRAALREAW